MYSTFAFFAFSVFLIFFLYFMADGSMDAALAECAAPPQAWAGAMTSGSCSAAAMAIARNRMTFTPLSVAKTPLQYQPTPNPKPEARSPMVVLNRIYTRTGDDGTTSLGSGARRKKYDLRVEAYGTVDEVNAVIGLVRLHTAGDAALDAALGRIQNDLFDVEADLCLSEKGPGGARLTVTDAQVEWLEGEIDRLNGELEPLKSFILPGGSPASAYLHLARTVCRRAERVMVELKDAPGEGISEPSLKYVNRLSDYLFVAGRYANDKGARDVLWAPGQNR